MFPFLSIVELIYSQCFALLTDSIWIKLWHIYFWNGELILDISVTWRSSDFFLFVFYLPFVFDLRIYLRQLSLKQWTFKFDCGHFLLLFRPVTINCERIVQKSIRRTTPIKTLIRGSTLTKRKECFDDRLRDLNALVLSRAKTSEIDNFYSVGYPS